MPKNDKSMIQSSILLHTTVDKQFWVNKIVKISTMINENLNNTQDLEMINNQSLTLTFPAGAIFGPFQSTSMPLISIFRVSFWYVHLPVK